MRQVDGDAEQLCLFEGMREEIDMKALKAKRDQMLATGAASLNTRRAIELDWAGFEAFCKKAGREPLPATPETLELYIVAELERGMKCSTVARRVCTVSKKHKKARVPSPVTTAAWELLTKTRIDRQEKPNAKAALSAEEIRKMSRTLGHGPVDTRDRALLVVGLASGMRRSELRALDLADIEFERRGFTIHQRRAKNDQEGKGRKIDIFEAKRAATCPVLALKKWIRLRGKWPGPLFTRFQPRSLAVIRKRMGVDLVNQVVKRCVELIGLDPARYGAHSLRAGMVTSALDTGMDSVAIMRRTGHKSVKTLQRYDRPKPFSFDVMAKAL